METISAFINKYLTTIHFPTRIVWTDIVEIVIISFLVYQILIWIRDTKAWNLLKGIIVIIVFLLFAAVLNLSTILWIGEDFFCGNHSYCHCVATGASKSIGTAWTKKFSGGTDAF